MNAAGRLREAVALVHRAASMAETTYVANGRTAHEILWSRENRLLWSTAKARNRAPAPKWSAMAVAICCRHALTTCSPRASVARKCKDMETGEWGHRSHKR